MPKATMDENDRMMLREDDVGPAGQAVSVDSEAKAHAMQESPHDQLGSSIATAHAAHYVAALVGTPGIHA